MQNICNTLLNCLTGSCMSLVSLRPFYITKSFSGIRKTETHVQNLFESWITNKLCMISVQVPERHSEAAHRRLRTLRRTFQYTNSMTFFSCVMLKYIRPAVLLSCVRQLTLQNCWECTATPRDISSFSWSCCLSAVAAICCTFCPVKEHFGEL